MNKCLCGGCCTKRDRIKCISCGIYVCGISRIKKDKRNYCIDCYVNNYSDYELFQYMIDNIFNGVDTVINGVFNNGKNNL